MNQELLERNLSALPSETASLLRNVKIEGFLHKTKSGSFTLELDGIWIHSKFDPEKEAKRLAEELPYDEENRIYLLFGAGIGHIVPFLLSRKNITVIWLDIHPFFQKIACSLFDFESAIREGSLYLLSGENLESQLLEAVRGKGSFPVSFIPHRGVWQWKEKEYLKLKYLSEQIFRKKDVNLATLTRFEKIWAKNLCFNFPELVSFAPVSSLFGIASGSVIIMVGAGPSLSLTCPILEKYREQFILIAVDTAVPILSSFGVDPDLIFSVDPQALNSQYLEDYSGQAALVFDPTSTYHSLRKKKWKGFVTESPFPLVGLLERSGKGNIGSLSFGGSVSTNAASLASLMEPDEILFVGQDLSFSFGLAHSKGAVLEERLNHIESRKFRREMHNYRQLFYLPQKKVAGKEGELIITNEKMLIFKKWFEEQAKDHSWKNATLKGANLDGIPNCDLLTFLKSSKPIWSKNAKIVRSKIESIVNSSDFFFSKESLMDEIHSTIQSLQSFSAEVRKGVEVSKRIYSIIKSGNASQDSLRKDLKQMDEIDTLVSSKKGLNQILSLGIQRVILTITEGYEDQLSVSEKENEQLGIAKKSLLLYEGLYDSILSIRRMLKKSYYRLAEE